MNPDAPHYVYRAYDEFSLLLYIGCTTDVERRMAQHRADSPWHGYMTRLEVTGPFAGLAQGRKAERAAIDTEGAFFNASQADIQRTQANRNEAIRLLTACHIFRPDIDLEDLDDPVASELWSAECAAYDDLRDEIRAELKVGTFPFLTASDRIRRYEATRRERGAA